MIDATVAGAVARITLDRPEAHNALDRPAIAELLALLDDWAPATTCAPSSSPAAAAASAPASRSATSPAATGPTTR